MKLKQSNFTIFKISIIFFLFSNLFSCYPKHEVENNTPYDYEYPTNKREVEFRNQLYKQGFKEISFNIPIYKAGPIGRREYTIEMQSNTKISNMDQFDSIEKLRFKMANDLYNNIIEDSVIFDISEIFIIIKTKPNANFEVKRPKNYFWSFEKDSLEKWNNFKVIKLKENRYKRTLNL